MSSCHDCAPFPQQYMLELYYEQVHRSETRCSYFLYWEPMLKCKCFCSGSIILLNLSVNLNAFPLWYRTHFSRVRDYLRWIDCLKKWMNKERYLHSEDTFISGVWCRSLKMTHICGNPSVAFLLFHYKRSSGRSVSEAAPHFGNLCVY